MKLHSSVVDRLLYIFVTYGGHADDRKLRSMIAKMDLTPYERKTTADGEIVLVETEEYLKKLNQTKQ